MDWFIGEIMEYRNRIDWYCHVALKKTVVQLHWVPLNSVECIQCILEPPNHFKSYRGVKKPVDLEWTVSLQNKRNCTIIFSIISDFVINSL